MMLMPGSFYASSIVILSWITGSLAQPTAKRAAAIALINAVCNTPNSASFPISHYSLVIDLLMVLPVWTSYLYYSPPRYLAAFLVNLAAASLAIAFTVVTWLYLRRQNAKLDQGLDVGKNGPTAAQLAAGFRYIL